METIIALGAWNWMILAAVLFVLELLSPGIFLMWFGVAAAVTGLIVFRYDVSWQWQLVWFCGLSLASVLLAAKYLRKHPLESERPLLNERAVQLIGQSFDLVDPIVNGRGSIHIGDSIWRVQGPELPKGARITVVGADGTLLKVVAAGSAVVGGGLAARLPPGG
jgi:membrane protein implicated in regulation of membrane protease activity